MQNTMVADMRQVNTQSVDVSVSLCVSVHLRNLSNTLDDHLTKLIPRKDPHTETTSSVTLKVGVPKANLEILGFLLTRLWIPADGQNIVVMS